MAFTIYVLTLMPLNFYIVQFPCDIYDAQIRFTMYVNDKKIEFIYSAISCEICSNTLYNVR